MRKIFINELIKAAKTNNKIILLVGDLGFGVIEPFAEKYPKQIINAGVSEQNMIGLAAGLASEGNHVFVYSIANFPTFRCAEQIRNDIDYHKLSVTVVSVGAGVSYGNLGYSHHAIQDYALMRSFPNMLIASPSDGMELKACVKYLLKFPQTSYLRLDKEVNNDLHKKVPKVFPGKWIQLHKSKTTNKTILTTGSATYLAKKFIKKEKYKKCSINTLPLWGMKVKNKIRKQINSFSEIITIEDHLEDGGFGSWVKESINDTKIKTKIISKYISNKVIYKVGSKSYLLNKFGPK